MCVIDLVEEGGTIRGVAVEARDPQLAAGMRAMRDRFPLDPAGPHPVAQVLREGRSVLIQLDDPTLAGLAASGEHLDFMLRVAVPVGDRRPPARPQPDLRHDLVAALRGPARVR